MTYEEFEWHILRMVYEEEVERLQPSYLAYTMGLPHETVTEFLEAAVQAGLVELDVSGDGRLEYFVPGVDRARIPTPIWKQEVDALETEEVQAEFIEPEPEPPHEYAGIVLRRERADDHPSPDRGAGGADGGIGTTRGGADGAAGRSRPANQALARTDSNGAASNTGASNTGAAHTNRSRTPKRPRKHGKTPALPPNLQSYIRDHYGDTDGSLHRTVAQRGAVIERNAVVGHGASVHDGPAPIAAMVGAGGSTTAMVPFQPNTELLRVETSEDAFCDPSQTIFTHQIRVHGVASEMMLREQIQRLFEGFGYKTLNITNDRLRFERGSVTFILALVPLFVLILPLFVYLFLYCMGRSTIQQEPLELDVQIRQSPASEQSYDIDLTFIGLHGVVLGAADQRVLNQEIDTLRDELRWALTGS